MDEGQLDRAIDAAAGEMMAREPGRSLRYDVMARVCEGAAPAPRRLVWMTAAAGMALCGAVAIALVNRAPAMHISLPPAAQLPIAAPPIVPLPGAAALPAIALETSSVSSTSVAARTAINAVTPAELPSNDVSPIAPIETEPIVLAAIDVPQLEHEGTSIEALDIEPLTIEPLTASND